MPTLAPPQSGKQPPPTPPPAPQAKAPELDVLGKFPAGSITPQEGLDQPTWIVRREILADLARELRDGPTRYDLLMGLCGVDFPDRDERFDVVYHLYSMPRNARLRLKVPLGESDPVLPSLIPLWKAANWNEREVYDMFGVRFEGHPDLRRILMPEDYQGHPQRRDFPVGGEPVLFTYNDATSPGWTR